MGAMASQITSLTIVYTTRRRYKKTWKLRVTGLCAGNSPVTREFPAQRTSNAENVTSLALWQSSDCPNASKATLMDMDKYFMWIHYELLHNHNKAKHNKTMCIFLGIYCKCSLALCFGARVGAMYPFNHSDQQASVRWGLGYRNKLILK